MFIQLTTQGERYLSSSECELNFQTLVFSFQKRYMWESIDKIPSDGILTLILDQSVSF